MPRMPMDSKLRRLTNALAPIPVEETAAAAREFPPPSARYAQEKPEPVGSVSLWDYWRILHARRRTILSIAAAALAAAAVYNYVRVPTYLAQGAIQIDPEEPNIVELKETFAQPSERPDYLETQYKILGSRALARRVILRLGLDEKAEFTSEIDGDTILKPPSGDAAAGWVHPAVIDAFLDQLAVRPGKGTRLVDVGFESVDRELAPRVVNALADEYIEHNLETKWNATQKASRWLEQQLSTLRAKLETSESEVLDYATRHSILFVEERKNITTEKLAQLEEALTRAESERIETQSLAMLVEDAARRNDELPPSLSSDAYEDLSAKLTDLNRERAQLLVTFAPGYPKVRRMERQIEQLVSAIGRERKRLLGRVRESHQLAQARERLLRDQVLGQRRLVNRLSDDFIQYDILKRDAETNRQLYYGLLQRLKQAGVSAGLRASNIALLDPAEIPEKKHRPQTLLNFLLALAGGLVVGAAVAFVEEHVNTLVRTPEEVERLLGLPLLAVIPRGIEGSRKLGKREVGSALFSSVARNGIAAREEPAGPASRAKSDWVRWDPESGLSEAYRTLRSSLLLGWNKPACRLLITSAQPQEGKTTVSLNLACSLAQLGRRVLLIDADMRRPNCAAQLGVKAEAGLADYLEGRAGLERIVSPTPIEGLSLVAAGRSDSVASDLLDSPRLEKLFDEVGRSFDHVVIDSPPSLVLSDARTMARLVEGVVLVVSDQTDRGALLRTKQTFDDAGISFLGFAMNRVNLDNLDYGYYRSYGYYYAYSDHAEA